MINFTPGDISLSQILTDSDHLYPSHINELRTSINTGRTFNVKDYGAIGDNLTDDTTAIQLAVTAITVAGRGVLYFPAGKYLCSTSISFTSKYVTICGDGVGVSEIKFTADVDGLILVQNIAAALCYTVCDIKITTACASTHYGINFTGYDQQELELDVHNVIIEGADRHQGWYWLGGIYLYNGFYTNISHVWIGGDTTDTQTSFPATYGIHIVGTVGADIKIVACSIYFTMYGIKVEGGQLEGIFVTNCQIVLCQRGIEYGSATSSGNMLSVTNCHINAAEIGIFINTQNVTYGRFSSITNNFLLIGSAFVVSNGYGIYIRSQEDNVSGNSILYAAGSAVTTQYGIVLDANGSYSTVMGNTINNCNTMGLLIQTGAIAISVVGNTGVGNVANFLDQGTGTLKAANFV